MIQLHVRMLIAFFLSNTFSYWLTRQIILSIAWLEIKGKYNRIRKLKDGVSLTQKLTMSYLFQYIKTNKREFKFWYNFKKYFVVLEMILFVFLLVVQILIDNVNTLQAINGGAMAFSVVILFVLCLQFDLRRNTKYDRMRTRGENCHR